MQQRMMQLDFERWLEGRRGDFVLYLEHQLCIYNKRIAKSELLPQMINTLIEAEVPPP